MSLLKKGIAECIGTFVLVVFGCGVAIITSRFADNAFVIGTALAFGLVIVAMAYSVGNISGCHINPAVSLGMLICKKMTLKEFFVYVGFQIVGAILGALLLELIFMNAGFESFAVGANQVNVDLLGATPGAYGLGFLVEVVLTFVFVFTILGVTSKVENKSVSGVVIGLTLTLVHLLGIELTGTSVNPARSIGPALVAMLNGVYEPIQQIWIFILAPLVGAALAALAFLAFNKAKKEIKTEA